jgi:hypothetical protein
MGAVWWVYGIGWKGDDPTWYPVEINFDGGATAVTEVVAEDPEFTNWDEIPEDDPAFGELSAATTAALTEGNPPTFESAADFTILEAYEIGGKPDRQGDGVFDRVANRVTNTLSVTNPPHYAVVEVQAVVDQGELEPGQAPPTPEPDPDAPEIAVILERDIGNLRVRPAMFTIFSMVVFGITANVLHRRDKREAENRARDDELVEV